MSDKDLVMEHWERFEYSPTYHGVNHAVVCVGGKIFVSFNPGDYDAWSAAAEYTRERLEQIRQVRAEIDELNNGNWLDWHDYLRTWSKPAMSSIVSEIRSFRTLSRLEAILADLRRGMKA